MPPTDAMVPLPIAQASETVTIFNLFTAFQQWDVANTRVTARVIQSLKTGRLATAPGTVIEFEHEGGELEVNGVIVRSAVGVSFENSTRYLVAVRFHPDLKKWQVGVMFELDSLGVLRESRRRGGSAPDSALHGVSLAEISGAVSKGRQQILLPLVPPGG